MGGVTDRVTSAPTPTGPALPCPAPRARPPPPPGISDTISGGKHVLFLPVPRTRTTATVHVEVTDEFGARYVDEFSLSFHVHFHKLLKYLIALPVLAMGAVVLLLPAGAGASYADLRKAYHLG